MAAFGTNLATTTASASGTLPTSLGGTTVRVKDSSGTERFARIAFVSPYQVNYVMPTGTSFGSAVVTITNSNQVSSLGGALISFVGPGAYSANGTSNGVASAYILRIKANGTQSYEAIAQWNAAQSQYVFLPLNLGPPGEQVFLIQYATGFRYWLSGVTATIGGVGTPVTYAGLLNYDGLDQINLGAIPRSLIGAGIVNVVTIADGRTANTVQIQIQ